VIARTDNIELINRIANSEAVRPFIRPDGEPMDFSPLEGKRVGETGVVVLTNGEDAIGLFEITADKIYQAHTLFAATCRGRKAIDTAREMLAWMFDHNVDVVWGSTPRSNRKAVMFNRLVGAQVIGGDDEDLIFEYRKAA
jgi:hypothetical protein